MRIEREVLGGLLYKPRLIRLTEFSADWFFEKRNKEIASVLKESESNDPVVLNERIKEAYPFTTVTPDYLEELRIDGVGVTDVKSSAESLKIRYYKDQIAQASAKYAEYPNEKNLSELQEAISKMESVKDQEDDGSLGEAVEEVLYELENEVSDGILSYTCLDETLGGGMRGGMLLTIGARPGVGKSAYGINLACQMMTKQKDVVIDFFTLEMSKAQMLKRFLSRMTEINSYKLRNPKLTLSDEQKMLITAKVMEILDTSLRIHDTKFGLGDIERQIRIRHQEAQGRPYVAFVDYLGLIDVPDKRQPRHVQVGEITRLLKILTNELDVPIVLFSQLNRAIESRNDKKPNLSDLRESGSVEQDSNVVMFIYKDEETEDTIVSVAKNREGFTGDIRYEFFKTKMYFQERGFVE